MIGFYLYLIYKQVIVQFVFYLPAHLMRIWPIITNGIIVIGSIYIV